LDCQISHITHPKNPVTNADVPTTATPFPQSAAVVPKLFAQIPRPSEICTLTEKGREKERREVGS
jgi:hypothetical protein